MEKEQNYETSSFDNDIAIDAECKLYMALSSIPNSGLGKYDCIHTISPTCLLLDCFYTHLIEIYFYFRIDVTWRNIT